MRPHLVSGLSALVLFGTPLGGFADEVFSVEGLSPRMTITTDWLAAEGYKCNPSEDYPGFTWCRKHETARRRGEEIKISKSIVYGPDRIIAYVNKEISPAYFAPGDIEKETNRLSSRFKALPRTYSSLPSSWQGSAFVMSWGGLELSPLPVNKKQMLIKKQPAHAGILVDLIGKFSELARSGLPIYTLSGKLGFVWQATVDPSGQGSLRFFAADPSQFDPAVAYNLTPPGEGRSGKPGPPASRPPEVEPKPTEDVIASGTGFFISPQGYVLSNAHVVEGCSAVQAVSSQFEVLNARAVATDAANDIVLLKSSAKPTAFGQLRSGIRIGESVWVFGYPLYGLLPKTGNFTIGNVSATAGLRDDTRYLQISAPVQAGNSGGPVLDQHGNVVGMVVSKLKILRIDSEIVDVPQNVNFAIKAGVLSNFLETTPAAAVSSASTTPTFSSADLAEKAKAMSVLLRCIR